MKSTTMVAIQYLMQDWAEQIKSCQNRSVGMKTIDWCSISGITKGTYYYRFHKVREDCLESLPEEMLPMLH